MRNLLYVIIFMVLGFGVVDLMASHPIMITNNSLDGVSLELYDSHQKFIPTGLGPLFLEPSKSCSLQSSYSVENPKSPRYGKTMEVQAIHLTFQHSGLSYVIAMPKTSINILPSDEIVSLKNNSSDFVQVTFYDKNGVSLSQAPCWIAASSKGFVLKNSGIPNTAYIPNNVATMSVDLGSGLKFSMKRPLEASSDIFPNDQLVLVTNNSENFVNATLPDGNIVQFTMYQSRYILKTVPRISIQYQDLISNTMSTPQEIVMQTKDFNLF